MTTPHMNSRMTYKQRLQWGAERRKELPRPTHGAWSANERKQEPLALLAASMRGRVPELVSLKYRLMAVSPFGYFRGAVPVMAADLAGLPHSGILTQICGDAHVRNLGAYEAPDGRLVFDINDFDETLHAPFEWDLKRLAASLVLAGRDGGSKEGACREAVAAFACAYAELMLCLSEMPVLEVARFQVRRVKRVASISAVLLKAERATPQKTLEALTREAVLGDVLLEGVKAEPGVRIFNTIAHSMEGAPSMLTRVSEEHAQAVLASLEAYRRTLLPERRHFLDQYQAMDVGFKIVGTGSVGLRDYVVYLVGNGPGDPLFLQIKEETQSGWAPYVKGMQGARAQSAHEGERVAEGQRAMQFQSDPFLGWTEVTEGEATRPYLVRQLNDHKASIEVEDLHGAGLTAYASICGELLARGHARSGDAVVLRGYIGKGGSLGEALGDFAVRYADQTEHDWKVLVRSGLAGGAKPATADTPVVAKSQGRKAARPAAAAKGGARMKAGGKARTGGPRGKKK